MGATLTSPMTIRIVAVNGELLEAEDGVKAKGVLKYRTAGTDGQPIEGEMVLARTNAVLIAACLGSDDISQWPGHTVTVHHDPSITLGRERVGGIRICGSPELKKAMTVDIKRPRRKKPDRYTLHPTNAQGQIREQARTQQDPPPQPPAAEREPGAEG